MRRQGRTTGATAAPAADAGTLAHVTLVLLVLSIAIYVAGCVMLAWEGRRDAAVLLAVVGGVGLSIFTMP